MVGAWIVVLVLSASSLASAKRRVVVMPVAGLGAGPIQSALVARLRVAHTVVTPAEAAAVGRLSGQTPACTPEAITRVAVAVRADALICGAVDPPARELQLKIHNGANGDLVTTLNVRLDGAGLTEAAAASMQLRIEAALALTSRPPSSAALASGDPLEDARRQLSSPVADDRVDALLALSRLDDLRAVRPISCSLLGDRQLRVRAAAGRHLAAMDDLMAHAALRAAAARETDQQHRRTLDGLVAKVPQRAWSWLARLQSTDAARRRQAARALGRGASALALKALIRALQDRDAQVRLRAVEGLRNYAAPGARAAIRRVVDDPDLAVRQAAAALARAHRQLTARRALFRSYLQTFNRTRSSKPAEREAAVYALGIRSSESAERRLARMLASDSDPRVRIAAAWALVLMGGEHGAAALDLAAGNDASAEVRQAVKRYRRVASADLATEIARLQAASSGERRLTAGALSLIPNKVVLPHLVTAALCDRDPGVRVAALWGLARASSSTAIDTLKAALYRDVSARVRAAAGLMYVLVVWKDAPAERDEVVEEEKPDTEDPLQARPAAAARKQPPSRPSPPVDPVCPRRCVALQIRVGPSGLLTRSIAIENASPRFYGDDDAGMTSTPVAGVDVGLELYPATWFTRGWFSSFGIGASYSRFFGLSWSGASDPDTTHEMTHEVFTVEFLKFRWQPVRRPGVPTLHASFGLHSLRMLMNDEDGSDAFIVPDIEATSLSLGVACEIPVGSGYLRAGFEFLPTLSWGEVVEDREFGAGKGWGVRAAVGVGGPFSRLLGWRLDLTYTHYSLALEPDNPDASRTADSVIDLYLHGRASLTFNL